MTLRLRFTAFSPGCAILEIILQFSLRASQLQPLISVCIGTEKETKPSQFATPDHNYP